MTGDDYRCAAIGAPHRHLTDLPDVSAISASTTLPPDVHAAAIAVGWGIPHPMAGMPTVSSQTILIYAPRDAAERTVVSSFIRAAEQFARGTR